MSVLFRCAPEITYSVVDLPSTTADTAVLREQLASWVGSPELARLFALGGRPLTATDPRVRLTEAVAASHAIFDFRGGGRERWEADRVEVSDAITRATEAVMALVLREPTGRLDARLGSPAHTLLLGGHARTCLPRAELLAALFGAGLQTGHVWGLGSDRAADQDERALAGLPVSEPGADECDVLCGALSRAVPGRPSHLTVGAGDRREIAGRDVPTTGLAAHPREGAARATTADTYRAFLRTAGPTADQELVLVTSALHAPYQHLLALAEFAHGSGARITTVGAHIETSRDPRVARTWRTDEWLQELRSFLVALHRLDELERVVAR